jgi:hypothetical protein
MFSAVPPDQGRAGKGREGGMKRIDRRGLLRLSAPRAVAAPRRSAGSQREPALIIRSCP